MSASFFPSTPSAAPSLSREHSTPSTNRGSFSIQRTPTRDAVGYNSSFVTTPSRGVQCEYHSFSHRRKAYISLYFLDHAPPLTQPRPQALASPHRDSLQTSSFNASDFQDLDTGAAPTPLINASFIDAVSQSMGFHATDEEYRSSLHSIPMVCYTHTEQRSYSNILTEYQMAPDITKGHLQLSIYQTGLMYAILKECRAISESCRADRAIMSDIHTRLEDSFALTHEQKVGFHSYIFTRAVYADHLLR